MVSMKQVERQKLNQKLMRAAATGDIEAVQKLVLRGADIYCRDHQGDTALSLAAGSGYLDILDI
ncbi:Ankyrin repeat (plasmid) [Rickettsia felis URRWXCal2]|uniref:Putative ankyrin repeat protein RF_p14 n=2 Tax=Rickettsia felis TaxID=42862 RepID=Y2014_RICFE|nr:RecName: Full=Putative ankyrin repeat protein RF_p14 [Rickettsia felis URRWXCal2]AAY62265.1 Ankyrin repeat [Rickettsia felis URRWXCal2]KHO02184.1 ankyrin [Rickettsia felis str. LSU]KHO02185.1 ankyrin [Rickettsia felis str. LSU]KHO02389.1 ankyrin [Rickettsia felis]